ncbi:cobalamin-binding protein [Undibacterium sp. Jales W-56]|uniref:cobalamin-binding protein n=1 Tax=Undibacterium sp. Jales W-56 TaxID=2897325 RepID=UPI0021D11CCA|nr:cobalamin-binding protein [Undibacterium sp. Jales W-56]MCU6433043.1 cobalamin-binding protein [Undibacterium sp. Jales W-56]
MFPGNRIFSAATACVFALSAQLSHATVTVTDDAQHTITLSRPAQRIISLAPHATELLFEAGAGNLLVGVSDYSDYPEAAKKIASIGNVFALDLERIIALKPDLIVIWGTGNGKVLANKIRDTKIAVFESEPHTYDDIASSIERLAILTGNTETGKLAAEKFKARLEKLRQTYRLADKQKPLNVFYQIARKPLMTLNDQHMVSAAIRLCGGQNIFGALKEISPTVTAEAVLVANPDAIITGSSDQQDAFADWRQFGNMAAVKKDNLFTVKGDWLNRSGPRILDGTEMLCKHLATARTK